MKTVFVVLSHDMQSVKEKRVEGVFADEIVAEMYAESRTDNCPSGRTYFVEEWEIE